MKHIKRVLATLFTIACFCSGSVGAQELPDWIQNLKVSGLAFGDAYGVLDHHDDEIDGSNGFWFRRMYLTFDERIDDNLDFRVRFEASSPGDFSSSAKMTPFVKDMYIRWNSEGGHQVYLGLSSTPTWSIMESTWGYRHLEKTPLDLFKYGSSRDLGVAVKGPLDPNNRIRYHVMLGNGSGTKGETNDGKKVAGSLSFFPNDNFIVEFYADHENRPSQADRSTFHVFGAVRGEAGRVGVMLARQRREQDAADAENLDVFSMFGVLDISERVNAVARVDRLFDPVPDGAGISYLPFDPTDEATFILAGIDIAVRGTFHLIPNLEVILYDEDDGLARDNDVLLRTTFSVTF